jgi:hypothetical protein
MQTDSVPAASETAMTERRKIAFEPLSESDASLSSNDSRVLTGAPDTVSALGNRIAILPDPPKAPTSNADTIRGFRRWSRHLRRTEQKPVIQTEERFWLLYKWHGQVLSVDSETFEAELSDPLKPDLTEIATFQKTELSASNIALLRPGATFYWFVGYRDFPNGQRKRESDIWMKRGGRMEQRKYTEELAAVQNIWRSIDWSTSSPAIRRT